uniref:TATA-box binding protein associated factor, RNA polymerase I subunit C n=1 Tax=Haplochromis burtoni TaxID=8153 RepID=A0A3Q2WYS7_HAPBU
MDYQFPQELFPSFYNCGPPNLVQKHNAGGWASYDRVNPQVGSGPLSTWTFTSRHQVGGELWRQVEPVPVPLLAPKHAILSPLTPPDPMNFTEHMNNFFMDHSLDAFGCMSNVLSEHFSFKLKGQKEKYFKDAVRMGRVTYFLDLLKVKMCEQKYPCRKLARHSCQLYDVVHSIPPELLGSLLYDELAEQRDRLLFSEGTTGGALSFVPFSQSDDGSQHGCLLYPGNPALNTLNFHKVELQHHRSGPFCVDTSSKPFSFPLRGPVRQISTASLFGECCVAVRSDYLCGVWRFSERNEPQALQVVSTSEVATCISARMQKVRHEDSNLYFNAKSPWRWCEFTAHPRVVLYADRTGVDLTDIRVSPASCHTLFRISSTADCRSGERLVLSRYLGDSHSFHHLITTQYSAYIMDERFPCVPMLKWDHMMTSPPIFCHIVPGCASSSLSAGEATTKVLLSSQSSQEIMMLQYAGGRGNACFSRGPPQALLRPSDSLKHLPVQIPHRLDVATNRLSSYAAGLTCIQKAAEGGGGGEECMCVLQLTEAGDIFYQILEHKQPDTDESQPRAEEGDLKPRQQIRPGMTTRARKTAESLPPDSQLIISETSSDEDVVGPTQGPSRIVPETPERGQQASSFSEDSESEMNRNRRRMQLQVVVNDDSGAEEEIGFDVGVNDKAVEVEEIVSGASRRKTPVKLSSGALVTWKHWLQKLMQKTYENKHRSHLLQHFKANTQGLLCIPEGDQGTSRQDKCMQSLRKELRLGMSRRSLLVHSMVSTSLRPPHVVPLPNQFNTNVWTDPLSHRLTLSWQGEEAWQKWWKDQLGFTKEAKVQALRRRRRKEKEAKQATGRRLNLSASFTSSVSYQSALDDLSDSAGWSSGVSQAAWSDTEDRGRLSQFLSMSEGETSRAATPSTVLNDTPTATPTPTPTATPQRDKRSNPQQTPSRTTTLPQTQTLGLDFTPASQRRSKRPADDYLESLFAPQDDPSQSHYLDEGSSTNPLLASSQLRSSQSIPLRNYSVDLTRMNFGSPGSSQSKSQSKSQSYSQSQSSQGRLSQASQPKKKSRMGF